MTQLSEVNPSALHEVDPRKYLLEQVGDISDVKVLGPRLFVAVYEKPEKTKGGIIRPDIARGEDRYQGKVCLVLKKGVAAFKDDETTKWNGDNVEIGDWIVMNPNDGRSLLRGSVMCRFVTDTNIMAIVRGPDDVY